MTRGDTASTDRLVSGIDPRGWTTAGTGRSRRQRHRGQTRRSRPGCRSELARRDRESSGPRRRRRLRNSPSSTQFPLGLLQPALDPWADYVGTSVDGIPLKMCSGSRSVYRVVSPSVSVMPRPLNHARAFARVCKSFVLRMQTMMLASAEDIEHDDARATVLLSLTQRDRRSPTSRSSMTPRRRAGTAPRRRVTGRACHHATPGATPARSVVDTLARVHFAHARLDRPSAALTDLSRTSEVHRGAFDDGLGRGLSIHSRPGRRSWPS